MTRERLDAGNSTLLGVSGLRHGGDVVELALGHEEHALPTPQAEPAVVEIEVAMREELLLAALGEVWALGAGPGDGGPGRAHVLVDDSRVEIATPPRRRPRGVGVAVGLEQVVASGAANEVAQPFDALDETPG